MVIAADRLQARVVSRYISGLLHSTPVLEQLIASETKTAIELTTGITIEIHTASFRTVRGYTVVGAILDELAFFPTDDAADPDREIIAALRPAMATIRGAMLLCLSSPYARKGELYKAHRNHYGKGRRRTRNPGSYPGAQYHRTSGGNRPRLCRGRSLSPR